MEHHAVTWIEFVLAGNIATSTYAFFCDCFKTSPLTPAPNPIDAENVGASEGHEKQYRASNAYGATVTVTSRNFKTYAVAFTSYPQ